MEQRPRTTVKVPTRHATFIPLYAECSCSDFEGRQPDIVHKEGADWEGKAVIRRMILQKTRAVNAAKAVKIRKYRKHPNCGRVISTIFLILFRVSRKW